MVSHEAQQQPISQAPTATRWSWLWPLVSVMVLLVIAAVLASLARYYYDGREPDTFNSVFASTLLQATVIVIGGAVIAGLLGLIQEMRANRERDIAKRLELFRRMRAAHVRIARAQRLIRAEDSPKTYGRQMRALMAVTRDLEEVREEVKVSAHLYKKTDRSSIMEGIALIIIFLEKLCDEYITWCHRASEHSEDKPQDGRWVADFIKARKPPRSELKPSNEDWSPPDMMPDDYEKGLSKSKLTMRRYVYRAPTRWPSS
jgi:hypothetical protein